jgi:sugar phosphate isomerase/epimerase
MILTSAHPARDQSAVVPHKSAYSSVMVLPPSGSERGQVSELAQLEKALIKAGVRVISSGVTGRIVVEGAGERKSDAAQSLSDLERALVLARKSGAEVLLQVMTLRWDRDDGSSRWFALAEGDALRELATATEYESIRRDRRWRLIGPTLRFEAKLIDVESGEIVATADMSQSTVRQMSSGKYLVTTGHQGTISNEGPNETVFDAPDLRERVVMSIMGQLARLIASGKPRAPASPTR